MIETLYRSFLQDLVYIVDRASFLSVPYANRYDLIKPGVLRRPRFKLWGDAEVILIRIDWVAPRKTFHHLRWTVAHATVPHKYELRVIRH